MANKPKIFDAPPDGFAMAPVHPGEVLHEEIAARGLTAHALGLKPRVPANRLTGGVRTEGREARRAPSVNRSFLYSAASAFAFFAGWRARTCFR
jgi:hypothetical protein